MRQQRTIMENCICCLEATVYHYGINMAAWNVCVGTLYCQHYSLTHPNNLNQVFQSLPWPQVCQSKHLGMQTVFTNISERMGRCQELNKFQRGTVIGCHLCSKSVVKFPCSWMGFHGKPLGFQRCCKESCIEHLWDELERRLRARPSCPTSVCYLTNALLEEWSKIPINILLNLVESLPRRVEAVIAAKGGPT